MSHLGEAKISISVHIDAGSPRELLDAVIEMMQKYRLDLGVPVDFADEDDGVGGLTKTNRLKPIRLCQRRANCWNSSTACQHRCWSVACASVIRGRCG